MIDNHILARVSGRCTEWSGGGTRSAEVQFAGREEAAERIELWVSEMMQLHNRSAPEGLRRQATVQVLTLFLKSGRGLFLIKAACTPQTSSR